MKNLLSARILSRDRVKLVFFILACAYFLFLTTVRNFEVFRQGCLHAHDFALFVEALQRIASGDWNPYQTTRQLFFLNDHWEPIFLIVGVLWSPFRSLIDAGRFLLLIDALIIVVAAALILRHVRKDDRFWVLAPFLLFHAEVLAAPRYPIHPSSWAILPMSWMVSFYFSEQESGRKISFWKWALMLVLLSLMNEQFTVVAALLTSLLAMLRFRTARIGWTVLAFGMASHAWFAMWGRPLILGPVKDYSYYFKPSLGALIEFYRPDAEMVKFLAGFLIAGAVVFWGLGSSIRRGFRSQNFEALLFWVVMAGPILAGRFLTGSWHQYYNLPVIFLIALLYVLLVRHTELKAGGVALAVILPFTGSLDDFKNSVQMWTTGASNRCFENYNERYAAGELPSAALRRSEFQSQVRTLLRVQNTPTRVVLADGWIPIFLTEFPSIEFYAPGGSPVLNTTSFDWLILERNGAGAPYPWSPAKIERVLEILRPRATQILRDDKDGAIFRGPFDFSDLDQFYIPEKMKGDQL